MGAYYLCEAARARHPYYVESISMNLWSIEELCYYMRENVYLLDETILNEELCDWLGGELGLKRLRKILLRALEQGTTAQEFVLPIFKECGYLSPEELAYFHEQLSQIEIESQDVRKKMKADYLVNYGMLVSALGEYENIINRRSPGRLGIQFYAAVLENMATAYAKLFRFEEAAQCLWESYSTLKSRKVYEKYLRLLPLFLSDKQYRERIEEIRADRDLAARMKAEAAAIMKEGQQSSFAAQWEERPLEETLSALKTDYMKCTKN